MSHESRIQDLEREIRELRQEVEDLKTMIIAFPPRVEYKDMTGLTSDFKIIAIESGNEDDAAQGD